MARNRSALVDWSLQLEQTTALDGAVEAVRPSITRAFGQGKRADLLRGSWLGHAVHPLLTDLVLGSWTSAVVLDLCGGKKSAPAAQRLVGVGLLAAAPTAWTGWAEWSAAGTRDQRVGLVHAATNGLAIGLYAASWALRRRDRRVLGIGLSLAGAAVVTVGGYLGAHLSIARKVGSRDPAYEVTERSRV